MNDLDFRNTCVRLVLDQLNDVMDKTDGDCMSPDDVYIVWCARALQNCKALASTKVCDGMYYEITYNGDKHELYLELYKKFENRLIQIDKE